MWMSVGNRERRHFRSNGVSSCRRVRDVFQMMSCCCWTIDDNNNDTSCWDVTRVDCPTLGFSPFFLLLRKLVATGQYIKKYIEECVYWGLLSRLHPCDGTDPFHVVVFFREKENRVEQQPQEEDAQYAVRSLPLFVVSRL
jgi:hypothetical protein